MQALQTTADMRTPGSSGSQGGLGVETDFCFLVGLLEPTICEYLNDIVLDVHSCCPLILS